MKSVGIFGMGSSGISALKLALHKGYEVKAINQGRPQTWSCKDEVCGVLHERDCWSEEMAITVMGQLDTLVISPGISPLNPVIVKAKSLGVEVISEIEFAWRNLHQRPKVVIGVTGTNGKTTTVSMIHHLLVTAGKSVFLGGNIGTPFSEYARSEQLCEVVVLELSSFQLEAVEQFEVDYGMLLNIAQNHGERYDNMADYLAAKMNLVSKCQKEFFTLEDPNISKYLNGTCIPVTAFNATKINDIKLELSSVVSLNGFKLKGDHNIVNLYFVYLLFKRLELAPKAFDDLVKYFKGVEHRLEYVTTTENGISIYNDAKSTNWEATLSAVRSFYSDRIPLYLILGGQPRGKADSISPYLNEINQHVEGFYLIGETGPSLFHEIKNEKAQYIECLDNLLEKVKELKGPANLLFSPAFPSFDQFKNYAQRGQRFKSLFV